MVVAGIECPGEIGVVVFIFEKAPFPECHASTIAEVEPGVFLAAWFGGREEGAADVKIWQSRFEGGKWSPLSITAQEPGFPCWNPVLFRGPDGVLLLFYKVGPSPSQWWGMLKRSTDDGTIWSAAEKLPDRPDVLFHLALALNADNRTKAAIEANDRALRIAPDFVEARDFGEKLRR